MLAADPAFPEEIGRRGLILGGEARHPTATATTVRLHDGEVLITGGSLAETKAQPGGCCLIAAKNPDEVVEAAAGVSGAKRGCIEVRPVLEFETGG